MRHQMLVGQRREGVGEGAEIGFDNFHLGHGQRPLALPSGRCHVVQMGDDPLELGEITPRCRSVGQWLMVVRVAHGAGLFLPVEVLVVLLDDRGKTPGEALVGLRLFLQYFAGKDHMAFMAFHHFGHALVRG